MRLEDLGLIGNCQFSALIERSGSVVWCCLPQFDSEPAFGRLLDPSGGEFVVEPADGQTGRQRYLENTNILETVFDAPGGQFRIIDFAPRFSQQDRMHRPTQLVRIIEPLKGKPHIRVRCEPRLGWSKAIPSVQQGQNYLQFEGFSAPLRLAFDIEPTCLNGESFVLSGRRHLVLSWDTPIEEELSLLCARFLSETTRYWQRWVKHCNIPPHYQQEVIRSALVLKLHCFENTGAIIAAMTTSIPEAPGSGRTWDYRYCWLRDSYYVLDALRLLGHFEEREHFIKFLLDITAKAPDLDLKPLYTVDGGSDLEERLLENWSGFNNDGPVRVGNAAALHQQHDVFGELVLALTPVFIDDRFQLERTPETLQLVERLARKAIEIAGTPDAGIWEFRKEWKPQTFSSLMCWAAAERTSRIMSRFTPERAVEFRNAADKIHAEIISKTWMADRGGFASEYGGEHIDASLLQMAPLKFLTGSDPRLHKTVDSIRSELSVSGWLLRYRNDDGLGVPSVAFVICTFWLIEALAMTGKREESAAIMRLVREVLSPLGLISEDRDMTTGAMWGNYPQAYSHVGLIHAAFAASPRWSEFL
ncbi:MAG TPA: glycoside hydrolase family 15 protein [Gammaproteobacteria bacterium]|nr:glycoside hydrolase family 15 protein [Gammaproteobacteria bacterium]